MAGLSGIFLIIALVIISGVIAYVGDIVGRRMGRKRLSLFGLRPRHTAIVISVFAGMIITVVTLIAAMLVSKDVKDGFLRVEQMRQQEASLNRSVKQLKRLANELEKELEQADAKFSKTKQALDNTLRLYKQEQAKLAEVEKKRVIEQKKLAQVSAEYHNAELFARKQMALYERLRKGAEYLKARLELESSQPVLLSAEQPLDVVLVTGGQPTWRIRRQLDAFIDRLDEKARAAGAHPLPGGKDAVIIERLVMDEKAKELVTANANQMLNTISEEIHKNQGGIIVTAVSLFNVHQGEPVYIDFKLYRNLLVFHKGDELAEVVLDGRRSQPELMGSLVGLLRDKVSAKARAQNVMPRIGKSGNELFSNPRGAVGEMSYNDLFAVIQKLQRANGPAHVTVVAAEDTWTIGPLKVEMKVEPLS